MDRHRRRSLTPRLGPRIRTRWPNADGIPARPTLLRSTNLVRNVDRNARRGLPPAKSLVPVGPSRRVPHRHPPRSRLYRPDCHRHRNVGRAGHKTLADPLRLARTHLHSDRSRARPRAPGTAASARSNQSFHRVLLEHCGGLWGRSHAGRRRPQDSHRRSQRLPGDLRARLPYHLLPDLGFRPRHRPGFLSVYPIRQDSSSGIRRMYVALYRRLQFLSPGGQCPTVDPAMRLHRPGRSPASRRLFPERPWPSRVHRKGAKLRIIYQGPVSGLVVGIAPQ